MRTLYHIPLSPFCRKVRLALAEKRIPFELRIERIWERRPEFEQMNPAGTVPVLLEENGLVITAVGAPLQNGGLGETIRVRNTDTNRIILGTVMADGRIRIGAQ